MTFEFQKDFPLSAVLYRHWFRHVTKPALEVAPRTSATLLPATVNLWPWASNLT